MTLLAEHEYEFSGCTTIKDYIFSGSSMITVHLKFVAVETRFQRQGIGTWMMGRALDDFATIADRAGAYALTLSAISEQAYAFYKSLGFEPYGKDKGRKKMLLPAQSVIEARATKLSNT